MLAQVIASHLIDSGSVNDALWLDGASLPSTVLGLAQEIFARLELSSENTISPIGAIKAYLLSGPTLIVIDGAESLFASEVHAQEVFALLDSAWLIFTSRIKPSALLDLRLLAVPELNREHALDFWESLSTDQERSIDQFDHIWSEIGGNPWLLRLLFQAIHYLPLNAAIQHVRSEGVLMEIWQHISRDERYVWLSTLLFPQGMPYEALESLFTQERKITEQTVQSLVAQSLLTVKAANYHVSSPIASFLIHCVRDNLRVSERESALDVFLINLSRRVEQLLDEPYALCAASLLHLAAEIQIPILEHWQLLRQLTPQLESAGFWAVLSEQADLLRKHNALPAICNAWLDLLTSRVLRWSGDLQEAEKYLTQALSIFEPQSEDQADVFIEQAVIFRYRNQWHDARLALEKATSIYEWNNQVDGIDRCHYELAQLGLDENNPQGALLQLKKLSRWAARAWGMAGQAYWELEQYDEAFDAIDRAQAQLAPEHPNQGRLWAARGQIYDSLGQFDKALEYFFTALDLLNRTKDVMGYARVCNNLAAVYLKQPDISLETARRWLVQAQEMQTCIGDYAGLAITEQNLEWCDSM
jgi:tetratricopeptide (TPR) repeat protein